MSPIRYFAPHPTSQTYSAGGDINVELSPTPGTITRMAFVFRADITTTTATNLNDYWDRIIATLSLNGRQKPSFNFSNMRLPYHLSRFASPVLGATVKRPTVIANSQSNALQQFAYVIHFGVAPYRINPMTGMLEDNPYDLTAGIPPTSKGNLTLGGTFGAAAAPGTNVTVNGTGLDIYYWVVQEESGDSPADFLPRALPVWSMESPLTTGGVTSQFDSSHDIASGDYLHSALVMTTKSGARSSGVLGSFMVWSELERREIWKTTKWKGAEILSQLNSNGWPPSDDGTTLGVPAVTQVDDLGLLYLPLYQQANQGNPLYGVDMTRVTSGDLKFKYGIDDATSTAMNILYRRYQLNPEHPANQAAA